MIRRSAISITFVFDVSCGNSSKEAKIHLFSVHKPYHNHIDINPPLFDILPLDDAKGSENDDCWICSRLYGGAEP